MVTKLDNDIGNLLKHLTDNNMMNDTIIVFTSDVI